jgi:hypothetical protein
MALRALKQELHAEHQRASQGSPLPMSGMGRSRNAIAPRCEPSAAFHHDGTPGALVRQWPLAALWSWPAENQTMKVGLAAERAHGIRMVADDAGQ